MNVVLYHGSPHQEVIPKFGKGEDKHDYGKGFYLTEDLQLAKEWAVCNPNVTLGWIHKFCLNTEGLNILDFQNYNELTWLAELMKHRDADDSRRYRIRSKQFIEKYGIDTSDYDVIKGWRANASYFYIAKAFVRNEIDVDLLPELLKLGDLGLQYCIKTEKAFRHLEEVGNVQSVEYEMFNSLYNERDKMARSKMKQLINSEKNKLEKVFESLI